jgi:S1-C subfamily serine protease
LSWALIALLLPGCSYGSSLSSRPAADPPANEAVVVRAAAAAPADPVETEPDAQGQPQRRQLVRTGTGFFVTRAGYLVTSAHVLSGCRGAAIWSSSGGVRRARIVARDRHSDIALLKIDGDAPDVALLAETSYARMGESMVTVGFGAKPEDPRAAVVTVGAFEGFVDGPSGLALMQLHAFLHQGNSGGPIIDERGLIEGMVMGRYTARPRYSVALTINEIKRFLGAQDVPYVVGNSSSVADEPRKDIALRISALVQCTSGGAN